MALLNRIFPTNINFRRPVPQGTTAVLTVTIVIATETDATQILGKLHLKALTQVTELNAAQIVSPRRIKVVAQTTELNASQVLTRKKAKSLSFISEASLAQVLTPRKAKQVALSLETDSAITLNRVKLRALSQTVELDAAQILARLKRLAISIAVEIDAAQVLAVGAEHVVIVTRSEETDSTFAIRVNPIHALVNRVTETDAAQTLIRLKTKSAALSLETDAAQIIRHLKQRGISQATEIDLAAALISRKLVALGVASDMEEALIADYTIPPKFIVLDRVLEIDAIMSNITSAKQKGIGLASETDLARNVIPSLSSEGGTVVRRRHGVFYYGHRGRMGI